MTTPEDLLIHKRDVHSQNGEDGVIQAVFARIGTTTKVCCEFGAWDGVHLSNCRSLILGGWQALMIEGDPLRFDSLISTYSTNPLVTCVNRYVDAGGNSLRAIASERGVGSLDFLSIDIDGRDYEVLETLDLDPRVFCVEVNAGHSPDAETQLARDTAENNVGQPLQVFVTLAQSKGYELICYTGNAFFVRRDVVEAFSLPTLTSQQAYLYFLQHLTLHGKEWLYLVNLGIVEPHYRFSNPYLARTALGISAARAVSTRSKAIVAENTLLRKARTVFRGRLA